MIVCLRKIDAAFKGVEKLVEESTERAMVLVKLQEAAAWLAMTAADNVTIQTEEESIQKDLTL